MYRIVKHYRDNENLRKSFNSLAMNTFGLDFETWYQGGFWTDCYDPHSVVEDGKVIANVSVYRMQMRIDGKIRNWIQLGTVMTEPQHRGRGLIRFLINEIMDEFKDIEGMLLYANNDVLEFYPKFGFRKASEHVYLKAIENPKTCSAQQVLIDSPEHWKALLHAIQTNRFTTGCDMLNNVGLICFYILAGFGESVYYIKELNVWAIAQMKGDKLHLIQIFAKEQISLDAVIRAFGGEYREVVLEFAPKEPTEWQKKILLEQDSTFFVKGDVFAEFENDALRLPLLART